MIHLLRQGMRKTIIQLGIDALLKDQSASCWNKHKKTNKSNSWNNWWPDVIQDSTISQEQSAETTVTQVAVVKFSATAILGRIPETTVHPMGSRICYQKDLCRGQKIPTRHKPTVLQDPNSSGRFIKTTRRSSLSALKERFNKTFSQSRERRILRLLEKARLGDTRSFQLLRNMKTLASNTVAK